MASKKNRKPKDRFDEVLEAVKNLDRKTGLQFDDLSHKIGLVAEQVAYNTEQISKLSEQMELMRYELKMKADNVELMTLSRRVTVLERRVSKHR